MLWTHHSSFLSKSAIFLFVMSTGGLANIALGQFTVERSPWLDSEAVTDEPIEQVWSVRDGGNGLPLDVIFRVEGINPRKTVHLNIHEDTVLQLQPYRRYTRICVEPQFMMHTDRIWADPQMAGDTVRLLPLKVGMEVDLEPIEFMPGASTLYHTSIPTLEALFEFIQVNPTLGLALIGHEQSSSDNTEFESRERARAVWEYLVTQGIDPRRIQVEGRGSDQLRFPHPKTVEQAEANRRITIRVIDY
jgi:outer membrane protein OmpA-like peptidoglycan-associated protein